MSVLTYMTGRKRDPNTEQEITIMEAVQLMLLSGWSNIHDDWLDRTDRWMDEAIRDTCLRRNVSHRFKMQISDKN